MSKDAETVPIAVVEFDAIVYKAQTLVDGGLRLTLDLPETAIDELAQLMRFKRSGVSMRVVCVGEAAKPADDAKAVT